MLKLRQVHGRSMLPALKPNQLLIVATSRRVRIGDVVVIRHGGREKVKRVAQMDGDTIYVRGDNHAESTDSRQFGWIDKQTVQGKVIWPRNLTNRSYQK